MDRRIRGGRGGSAYVGASAYAGGQGGSANACGQGGSACVGGLVYKGWTG